MNCQEYANLFLVLGDENRVRIIQFLSREEMCGCELLKELSINQSTLSHHMKKLVMSDLVIQNKKGKSTFYRLNDQTLETISVFIKDIGTTSKPCKECCQ